jgi:uncharacterized protein
MSTKSLRPWTELVKLHPDVESDALTEAMFAIDLGAIATGDPNTPAVYRDARAFFGATYLTADLYKLLEEVLASLAGESGYNRVLKLRTPFGGGKSHTLAALLHAAKDRRSLDVIPESQGLADPGRVDVAVFDGEKFTALGGKEVEGGRRIQTMWGWLAWQIDPKKAFPVVEEHDEARVSPSGDVIREMLAATGRPVLLLLDEVLKYMERAAAVAVLDSTLQRQAKDFFQNLTVEVSNSPNAALVYSLTWSAREALGNVALLAEVDKLAGRVDQLREPVTGDEIMPVLQRRLLREKPDEAVASDVAASYEQIITGMRRSHAETASAKQQAEEEGLRLRSRIASSYPFHPGLIDLMRERWTAVDNFQRTRGALRFLASCLHSLKKKGGARPLLGPADVPLGDAKVRIKLLKELGAQNDYDPVITADIEGPVARAKRIDERLASDTPALANVKPAARLATAILLYSFGGLRRDGEASTETLPAGVTESELLSVCIGPDLDNITATAVLSELRNSCLYLHYDGVRYAFKKDPNVTKLIEDAEEEIAREETSAKGSGPVRERVREMLDERLAGHHTAHIWPTKSQDIPHEDPRFLVGYMPLEFAGEKTAEQDRIAKELLSKYGDKPRRFRNGIGLAIPDKKQVEPLRRAVRYLLAIKRVEDKKQQYRLTKDQFEQLKERKRTEEGAAESSLRDLYGAVWLPRIESSELGLEKIEKGGKPLQATGIHERVMELLTSQGSPKVHATVTPRKIVDRLKLGEAVAEGEPPRLGIKVNDIVDAFFEVLEPPRLDSAAALRKAIVRGVSEGAFAYTSGSVPTLGTDNKYQISRDRVSISRQLFEDEVDLESGFLIMPAAIPEPPAPAPDQPGEAGESEAEPSYSPAPTPPPVGSPVPVAPTPIPQVRREVEIVFSATRDQIFKAFPAIANLAEKSDGGKVTIRVQGASGNGFDPAWLRNAVEEPLDEADIEFETGA